MFSSLNASNFAEGASAFYHGEFERILICLSQCYELMLVDDVELINDENEIRDVLYLKYLNKNEVRKKVNLVDYNFEREVQEDASDGRVDIKITSINSFKVTEDYYILECKRMLSSNSTGVSGYNAKYIENGICRFVSSISNRYSSYHNVNAMIGFVVEKMDIHSNMNNINTLLSENHFQSNTVELIKRENFIENFEYIYSSKHKVDNVKEIKLYHLMFDFEKNISS